MDFVESRVKELEGKMERVLRLLEGNGKPGLLKEFESHKSAFGEFMAVWQSRERDKGIFDERQERARIEQTKTFNGRMNILIGVAGLILALVMAVIGVLSYERASGHAILSPTRTSGIEGEQALEHAYKEWYAHNE
jgi:hypothetical protein